VERLNFPESVRHVAALVGIEISEEGKSRGDEKREYLLRINQYAMNLYHRNLLSDGGREAYEYALKRGLTGEESIKEFKLGYSPDSWNYLTDHLSAKGVSLERAAGIGLVALSTKSAPGRYYDRFRNRLIFPIINQKNEVIAFGGRVIGDGEPKYLNSPESELFNKGTILYGLNAAREHISELKRAIVVEGYLDVIGCHQNGIRNVVAPMGTALTLQQVELLSRFCTEVVMLFDADSAGIKASLRSLDVTAAKNVTVRVAQLPGGEDPFEFIVKRGMRQFMAVVDSAVSPDDFRIQRVFEETRHFDTMRRLTLFFEVVREAASETAKSLY
jgi:DNA primase